jgi:uncharacterized protein (DUF1015 family)
MAAPTDVPAPDGLVLAPFRALRFDPAVAGSLSALLSPPYDVIDDDGVARYESMSPYNVVRLILPRGPESGTDSRYIRAADLLRRWREAGALVPDPDPALYVYEMRAGEHVQRGLLGALGLVDPDAGIVLPHENTMAGPVSDRLRLTEATDANLEPIFLIYDGGGVASAVVADVGGHEPVAEADTGDGVVHRLWMVTDPDVLRAIEADLRTRRAVIADGHHRYANFRQNQANHHAAGQGPGPWDHGLAFLVDATAFGPQVHAIHRVVPALDAGEGARRAEAGFTVRRLECTLADPADAMTALAQAGKAGPAFLVADDRGCWLLTDPTPELLDRHVPTDRSGAWRSLDVTVAHSALIRGLWGLTDDESTVGYRHDVASAHAAVRANGGLALVLNPTPVDALIAVAAAGERMPRKSTFFTPKPATGMAIRDYRDA